MAPDFNSIRIGGTCLANPGRLSSAHSPGMSCSMRASKGWGNFRIAYPYPSDWKYMCALSLASKSLPSEGIGESDMYRN